jgi:hypothetical protein
VIEQDPFADPREELARAREAERQRYRAVLHENEHGRAVLADLVRSFVLSSSAELGEHDPMKTAYAEGQRALVLELLRLADLDLLAVARESASAPREARVTLNTVKEQHDERSGHGPGPDDPDDYPGDAGDTGDTDPGDTDPGDTDDTDPGDTRGNSPRE